MAYDKVVDSAALDTQLTSIADAIRAKTGGSDSLVFPDGFLQAIAAIEAGGGSGGGQAFQCGTVVSADGTNLVVPCTLDNILIVRNFPPSSKYTAYLLNANLLVADGMKFQLATSTVTNITNQGIRTFLITKENGQTTFTQTTSTKFNGEYCYIAWDNAE